MDSTTCATGGFCTDALRPGEDSTISINAGSVSSTLLAHSGTRSMLPVSQAATLAQMVFLAATDVASNVVFGLLSVASDEAHGMSSCCDESSCAAAPPKRCAEVDEVRICVSRSCKQCELDVRRPNCEGRL